MLQYTLVTCAALMAVDGDTVKCDGVRMRDMGDGSPNVAGFDAPEIYGKSKCPEEALLGAKAMVRYAELLAMPGVTIQDSGQRDRNKRRPLVVIRLQDGRTLGGILIAEGLAKEWRPNVKIDWCN